MDYIPTYNIGLGPTPNVVMDVQIAVSSPYLRTTPFPQTDIHIFRYNYLTGWSNVNFYYSNGRNDNWRGDWGEETNEVFYGPLNENEYKFVDYNAPKGFNIYFVWAWSWVNGWKSDGWLITNWVWVD